MRRLRQRLSGIAVPTYVLDIPGGAGKVTVGPSYMGEAAGQSAETVVSDAAGRPHVYPPLADDVVRETEASEGAA
jgi:lysine 2,3-aminomutase